MLRRPFNQWRKDLRLPIAELLIGPLLFAAGKWDQEIERLANAAAIARLVIPKVDPGGLTQSRQRHQSFEIEDAVTPGPRAFELERLTAVGFDLQRDPFTARIKQNALRQILVSKEQRE